MTQIQNWCVAYVSEACIFERDAVTDLVSRSKQNNSAQGLTGVLLDDKKQFLQVLEGDSDRLGACLLKIMGDDRHRNVRVFYSAPNSVRYFSNWSMTHTPLTDGTKSIRTIVRRLEKFDGEARIRELHHFFMMLTALK